MSEHEDKNILFFDGVCVLCNGFADYLLKKQQEEKNVYLASLQGETAKRVLPSEIANSKTFDSLIFWQNKQIHTRSEAVFRVLPLVDQRWRCLKIFRIVPRILRDAIYRLIAASRYRFFGKIEQCRVPSEREKTIFLP